MKKYCKKYLPLKYKIKAAVGSLFFTNKKWETYKASFTKVKIYREPKLIMTLLVKDEGDILEQNLKFHKSKGIDGFIVTDNGSKDNTCQIINKYIKLGWILEFIKEDNQEYKQADWVHRMDLLAIEKYKADWIINADADEFFYTSKSSLKECLNPICSAIQVKNYAMLSLNEENWINNTFITINNPSIYLKAKLVFEGKLSVFPQLVVSHKTIVLASAYKRVTVGNHYCDISDLNNCIRTSEDIMIYHYSYRGFEHFKRKVINGGQVVENNIHYEGIDVGSHWRFFYDEYKKDPNFLIEEYKKVNGSLILDSLIKNNIIKNDTTMYNILATYS